MSFAVLCYRNGNRNEEPVVATFRAVGGWLLVPQLKLGTTFLTVGEAIIAAREVEASIDDPEWFDEPKGRRPLTVHALAVEPFEVPESLRRAFPGERTVIGPEVWPSVVGALASLAEG